MLSLLAEVVTVTDPKDILFGIGTAASIFLTLFVILLAFLALILPLVVWSIYRLQRKQNLMIEQLVKNSVAISQQLSRLPQAPPPGAARR